MFLIPFCIARAGARTYGQPGRSFLLLKRSVYLPRSCRPLRDRNLPSGSLPLVSCALFLPLSSIPDDSYQITHTVQRCMMGDNDYKRPEKRLK